MSRVTPWLFALVAAVGCGVETRANPNYHAPKKAAVAHTGGSGGHGGAGSKAGTGAKDASAGIDASSAGRDAAAGADSAGTTSNTGSAGRDEAAAGVNGNAGATGIVSDACNNTCSTPLPACDESTRRCVECLKREDCPDAARPACSLETQSCVECAAAGDCSGSTPACDPQTRTCVQCLGNDDCGAPASVCDPDSHVCVECLRQSDCGDPTKALCNEKLCVPCTVDTHCTRFTATPVCDRARGTCVECTADTEADRCGTKACKRSSGTCTAIDRGTRTACGTCEADSECVSGARCVLHEFDTQPLGLFCLYDQASNNSCANANHPFLRPYSLARLLTSIDGSESTYCLPPASTTCSGIADAIAQGTNGGKPCSSADDCGAAGVSDGVCGDTGTTASKCTYACQHDYDCPQTGFTVCDKLGTGHCQ